jgi:hypothetical protein
MTESSLSNQDSAFTTRERQPGVSGPTGQGQLQLQLLEICEIEGSVRNGNEFGVLLLSRLERRWKMGFGKIDSLKQRM